MTEWLTLSFSQFQIFPATLDAVIISSSSWTLPQVTQLSENKNWDLNINVVLMSTYIYIYMCVCVYIYINKPPFLSCL